MSVSISFGYPEALLRNATTRQAILNAANFLRDLWLARAPYAGSGPNSYAAGLKQQGSIRVSGGKITITNLSPHAWYVEKGHKSFNIGLAMLANGKGVEVSADGNRYKRIKIEPSPTARFRRDSVAENVKANIQKLIPYGMLRQRLTKYGAIKPYQTKRSLMRPLKGGAPKAGTPKGVFTISEKAILENPMAWQMPRVEGKYIARDVQREGAQIMRVVIREAMQAERNRQLRSRGKSPKFFKPGMMKKILEVIPPKSELK